MWLLKRVMRVLAVIVMTIGVVLFWAVRIFFIASVSLLLAVIFLPFGIRRKSIASSYLGFSPIRNVRTNLHIR